MSPRAQKTLEIDGASVAYFDGGQGPLLVFVHGFFLSSRTWRKVLPDLCADHRCIAIDLLGAGDTRCGADAAPTLEGQVNLLAALFDALNLDQAVLIAHDSGAMVTRQYAATYPRRVRGLVLSDTEIPGHRVRSFSLAARLACVPGLSLFFEWLLGSRLLWDRLLRAAIHDVSEFDVREFLEVHREPLRRSRDRRRDALRAGVEFDSSLVEEIDHERLSMPKLVLWGEQDRFIPPESARAFQGMLPSPRSFAIIENCGTLPHEERPTQWVAAVRSFLSREVTAA